MARARRPGTPPLEWAAAAFGGAALAFMAGYMIVAGLAEDGESPVLSVRAVAVGPVGEGHLVAFVAANAGTRAAAAVQVRGELRTDGGLVETAEAELDYVPQRSTRSGGLLFRRDPAAHELVLGVVGFADP